MTHQDFDPLFGSEQLEIPLVDAPLVRVIAQVQVSPILKIASAEFVSSFQESIRDVYPDMEQEAFEIEGPTEHDAAQRPIVIWRFYSSARDWRISLSTGYLAIETQRYVSRADFMERLEAVVAAFKNMVGNPKATRIGIRYVDHVHLTDVGAMSAMLRPEMLGATTSALGRNVKHCVTEAAAEVAEGMIFARWGLLPPNGTHDPDVMMPAPTVSWFLDLDVSTMDAGPFRDMEPGAIRETATKLAIRCYSFFRWAVTDEFILAYGGKA